MLVNETKVGLVLLASTPSGQLGNHAQGHMGPTTDKIKTDLNLIHMKKVRRHKITRCTPYALRCHANSRAINPVERIDLLVKTLQVEIYFLQRQTRASSTAATT